MNKPKAGTPLVSNDQVKRMVERFLQWKLPENFNPDGGISFKRMFNEHTDHPMKNEPVGTNLFDYTQAEQMVRYLLGGEASSPAAPADSAEDLAREISDMFNDRGHTYDNQPTVDELAALLRRRNDEMHKV